MALAHQRQLIAPPSPKIYRYTNVQLPTQTTARRRNRHNDDTALRSDRPYQSFTERELEPRSEPAASVAGDPPRR